MMDISGVFIELLGLPMGCVYRMYDSINKKFIVRETSNLLQNLLYTTNKIKLGQYSINNELDFKHVQMEIITVCDDSLIRGVLVQEETKKWVSLGWKCVAESERLGRAVKRFKIKKRYIYGENNKVIGVGAVIYSYYKDYETVGVFNTIKEYNEFINRYYPNSEVTTIIYALNYQTKEFLKSYVYNKHNNIQLL